MKKILIKLIKLYQITPTHMHTACRFYPTCSNYAIEALETYNIFKALYLIIKRLLKCNPFNKKSGIDLLPPKNN